VKHILQYTLKTEFQKPGEQYKTHEIEYEDRKDAESAAHMMREKIYWHRIVAADPQSKWPKYTVATDVDLGKTHEKLEGWLETHFETGMECLGLVLDQRIPDGPNPNFDPTKPEDGSNFKNFRSYAGLHYVGREDVLEVDGERILMARDRDFAQADGYRLSLYPSGFSSKELIKLFNSNKKATLWQKRK